MAANLNSIKNSACRLSMFCEGRVRLTNGIIEFAEIFYFKATYG